MRLTVEPVEGSIGYAASAPISRRARLSNTTSCDDTVDHRHTLGQAQARVAKLEPLDGARLERSLVGIGGNIGLARLADSGTELGLAKIEGGSAAAVKVVAAEELERRRVADLDIGGGLERLAGCSVFLAGEHNARLSGLRVDEVERDRLSPQDGRRQCFEGGLRETLGVSWVE